MEERDSGFSFYCSQDCHGKSRARARRRAAPRAPRAASASRRARLAGRPRAAASCATRAPRTCRRQLLAEAGGARLGVDRGAPSRPPSADVPAPTSAPQAAPPVGVAPPRRPRDGADTASRRAPSATSEAAIHAPARLAVFNHKGGTGKTTTTVSVAAGPRRARAARPPRRHRLAGQRRRLARREGRDARSTTCSSWASAPQDGRGAGAPEPRSHRVERDARRRRALPRRPAEPRSHPQRPPRVRASTRYDFVVLDCSPSLSLMNQNALVFADGILVPVACDFLSLVGVRQVIKTVKNVNALLHHPVQIYGVLPTFYDARARICRDAVETLKRALRRSLLLPPIRAATQIKEAPAQGKTIFEYAPDSNAADDYQRVVDVLVDGARGASVRARAMTRRSRATAVGTLEERRTKMAARDDGDRARRRTRARRATRCRACSRARSTRPIRTPARRAPRKARAEADALQGDLHLDVQRAISSGSTSWSTSSRRAASRRRTAARSSASRSSSSISTRCLAAFEARSQNAGEVGRQRRLDRRGRSPVIGCASARRAA